MTPRAAHGSGADEESDRPGALSCPAFSPDGRNVTYLRTYDVLQQDGSRNELDVSDLRGRIRLRRDVADQSSNRGRVRITRDVPILAGTRSRNRSSSQS